MSWLSRTPSSEAISLIRVAAAPAFAAASMSKSAAGFMRPSERQKSQDQAVQEVRSPHRVSDHSFAVDLNAQVGDLIRADGVRHRQVGRADQPAQRNRLLFGIDSDVLL